MAFLSIMLVCNIILNSMPEIAEFDAEAGPFLRISNPICSGDDKEALLDVDLVVLRPFNASNGAIAVWKIDHHGVVECVVKKNPCDWNQPGSPSPPCPWQPNDFVIVSTACFTNFPSGNYESSITGTLHGAPLFEKPINCSFNNP